MKLMSLAIALLACSQSVLAAPKPSVPGPEEIPAILRANRGNIRSLHLIEQSREYRVPWREGGAIERAGNDVDWGPKTETWWQNGELLEQQASDWQTTTNLVRRDGKYTLTTGNGLMEGKIWQGGESLAPLPEPHIMHALLTTPEHFHVAFAEDRRLVVDRVAQGETRTRYVFAPACGYAFAEEIHYFSTEGASQLEKEGAPAAVVYPGGISRRIVYDDFREVADGVWIAFSALDMPQGPRWGKDGADAWVRELRFENVVVNEPIPASRFTLPFPRGTHVTDYTRSRLGERYTVGALGLKAAPSAARLNLVAEKALVTVGQWLE